MPKLTKTTVEGAPIKEGEYFLWDEQLPGFGVRIFPSGKRGYLVQYRAEGRSRRVAIGLHGRITCDEARKMAQGLLGDVAKGGNPAETKKLDREALTVHDLCALYIDAIDKGLVLGKRGLPKKASTVATDRGRIERHILPLLGQRKVRDLTTPDIVRFMRDVASGKTAADIKTGLRGRAIVEGGKGTAARTVGLLGGILSFAVTEGVIASNPARGVRRPADERRQVVLSPESYRALGEALRAAEAGGERWQIIAATRLLAFTGCRKGEIESLRWDDVDFSGHCLRLSDTKTGRSVRPLGAAALRVLASLPRQGGFVLPGVINEERTGEFVERHFGGMPKAWPRLILRADTWIDRALKNGEITEDEARRARLTGVTLHGLRHGFASVAADIGLTEITIAALLGHASGTVTGRYIHHVDTALVGAADRVAGRIAEALDWKNDGADVVPFPGLAAVG